MLSLVRRKLDEEGIQYEYLDGKTRDRQKRVERFQNDDECVEAQAIDRAHRVGQTKQVFAYRLICRDTVEEKIAELQIQKKELADSILQAESGNPLKDMSVEDLELLFS